MVDPLAFPFRNNFISASALQVSASAECVEISIAFQLPEGGSGMELHNLDRLEGACVCNVDRDALNNIGTNLWHLQIHQPHSSDVGVCCRISYTEIP